MSNEGRTDEEANANGAAMPEWCAVFDLVNDGVFVHDLETGAILDANRRAELMYGLGRDALRGSTIDSLSEGRAPYNQRYALALIGRAAAGEPQVFEWRARRSSGELFWVEVNLSRVGIGGVDRLIAVVRDITDRKRVEDALRESEDRARRRAEELDAALAKVRELDAERSLAVDALERGDAVIVLDAEFRIVLVNENEERLSRRSRGELLGRVVWDVFPEGASPDTRYGRAFERVMRERVPETFDEYYAPLGVWTGVSVHPTQSGGIAVFIRDVTERKRAEEALREQEAFASRVLDSSLNGIYVIDVDAERPIFVNARYTQLTGYTLDDLRARGGRLIEQLFHPDDRARMRAHLEALVRAGDGEVLDVEYRFRTREGRWISCFSRETPFARAPDGRVRQLIGTFVDVTELRGAEDAARESEARYRTLFESMTEGFALLEMVDDLEGRPVDARFVEVNPAFERLTGVPRASVAGKLLSAVAPEECEFWLRAYGQVAVTGEPAHVEHRSTVVARDYEVYAFSPRHGQFALLFVDITDLKRIERELRDADRRKNEFLGVLSHELRNPLAPIRNSIYLLNNAPPESPEAVRSRHVLLRQTEQLNRLVDDLLDVTRVSRGKITLRRAPVDARELILRVCEDLRSLFEAAGVELRTELPDTAAWLDADASRIAQVVGNLLQNAAKFTQPGGAVVVAARAAGGALEVRVRDNGIGIDRGELERIFEPFAQVERGGGAGGLGLGLALVKALVELHGGSVAARSEGPGRGAEFAVTLPLGAPPPEQRGAPAPPAAAKARRLVLVVEDNADAGRSLADVLEFCGHRVRVAPDGRTAIALAHRIKPDVVLCDLGLPDMSGYDVARAMRGDEALRRTRLIALSGYAQPEDRKRALETGFDAHVAKPAAIEALDALLAE